MNMNQPRLDDRLNAALLFAAVCCITTASALTMAVTVQAEASVQLAAQQAPVQTLPVVAVVAKR